MMEVQVNGQSVLFLCYMSFASSSGLLTAPWLLLKLQINPHFSNSCPQTVGSTETQHKIKSALWMLKFLAKGNAIGLYVFLSLVATFKKIFSSFIKSSSVCAFYWKCTYPEAKKKQYITCTSMDPRQWTCAIGITV